MMKKHVLFYLHNYAVCINELAFIACGRGDLFAKIGYSFRSLSSMSFLPSPPSLSLPFVRHPGPHLINPTTWSAVAL